MNKDDVGSKPEGSLGALAVGICKDYLWAGVDWTCRCVGILNVVIRTSRTAVEAMFETSGTP